MADKLRLDKWLWQARFFKTRSLAARQISEGRVRVNSERITKTSFGVAPGDVLTFAQGRVIRVVEIAALGTRRGPAPEAQALYHDRTPVQDKPPANPRYDGKGRPTGRDRRTLDLARAAHLEGGGGLGYSEPD